MKRILVILLVLLISMPAFALLRVNGEGPKSIILEWDKIGSVAKGDYVVYYESAYGSDKIGTTTFNTREVAGIIQYTFSKNVKPFTPYYIYIVPIISGQEDLTQASNGVSPTTRSMDYTYVFQGRDDFAIRDMVENYAFTVNVTAFPQDVTKFVVAEDVYILSLNTIALDAALRISMGVYIDSILEDGLSHPRWGMAPMLYTGYLKVRKGEEFAVIAEGGEIGNHTLRIRMLIPKR